MTPPTPHDDERWMLTRAPTPRQPALLHTFSGGILGRAAFVLLVLGE